MMQWEHDPLPHVAFTLHFHLVHTNHDHIRGGVWTLEPIGGDQCCIKIVYRQGYWRAEGALLWGIGCCRWSGGVHYSGVTLRICQVTHKHFFVHMLKVFLVGVIFITFSRNMNRRALAFPKCFLMLSYGGAIMPIQNKEGNFWARNHRGELPQFLADHSSI